MKYLLYCCCFLFTLTLPAQNEKDVLAIVGNKQILLKEFTTKFDEVKKNSVNPPTKAQFLEDYIRYHVGLQEAYKRKLEQDPIVIDRLQQEMYKALLERELAPEAEKIKITESDMREFYKSNPEIRSSHILIQYRLDAAPEVKAEAKKRALEIYEDVKKSKRPFEDLAKIYSDDNLTKNNGGDLGFQSRASLLPIFYNTMLSMKTGEIRGVFESSYGFHIIKVTDRRTYENSDKSVLKPLVFDEKRRALMDRFFDKLKKSYPIKVNKSLIQ